MRAVLVAAFGAAGAMSRYAIGRAVGVQSFPWATLAINVVGSFALGVVLIAAPTRWPDEVVVGVAVGFLGAFTTFSTFSFETQTLLRTHRVGMAAVYVGVSIVAGVLAAAAGYVTGRATLG